MRRAAIFVLSDVRSGSTLLDQCLGAHPSIVSLGEVHWLPAYLSQDRTIYDPVHPLVCTCGKPAKDCEFWQQVTISLGRPLASLRLRQNFKAGKSRQDLLSKVKRLPRRLVRTKPALFRLRPMQWILDGPRIARDSVDLFDAVSASTRRPYCVDSSKSPFRFRAVHDVDRLRTLAIVLTRDYRAVVRSKMKRGQSIEAAASGWRKRMVQIDALTSDLPAKTVHHLKYESLCENPKEELTRLCRFLDLQFVETMLQRPTDDIHHIGGSPSKFDSSRVNISLDKSYVEFFQPDSLKKLRNLVGDVAERWGY